MSSNPPAPDYDLEDLRVVTATRELRAMADPLRSTILDLVLERAATVAELAAAVGRPNSTVAHHVNVLVDAGLLTVVRTRKVRAIQERFYGRTARVFYVGAINPRQARLLSNSLAVAAAESGPAHEADDLRAIIRHARIPRQAAAEFWTRVFEIVSEFSSLPRSGDTVYGFVAGLYPVDYPSLPGTVRTPVRRPVPVPAFDTGADPDIGTDGQGLRVGSAGPLHHLAGPCTTWLALAPLTRPLHHFPWDRPGQMPQLLASTGARAGLRVQGPGNEPIWLLSTYARRRNALFARTRNLNPGVTASRLDAPRWAAHCA